MGTAALIARHKVNDYAAWRTVYDSMAELRRQHGRTHEEVLAGPATQAHTGSAGFKEAMGRASVAGPPRIDRRGGMS